MKAADDDREIRATFDALRDDDRDGIPSFAPMWSEAKRRASLRSPGRWVLVASLVGATAAIGLATYLLWPASSPGSIEDALALAEQIDRWRAPSDVLLNTSYGELGDSVPSLELDSLDLPPTEPDDRTATGDSR